MSVRSALSILATVAILASPALGLTFEEKCQTKKLKEVERYLKCRLSAENKAIKKETGLPDFAKCDSKFTQKFAKTESVFTTQCTTEGDGASLESHVKAKADEIIGMLMPNTIAFACNALAQTGCQQGEGCYVNTDDDPATATCANDAFGLAQDDACNFQNSCSPGLSCILIDPQGIGRVCAQHCAVHGPGPACPGTHVCVQVNRFYSDVNRVPADLGFCVDPNLYNIP